MLPSVPFPRMLEDESFIPELVDHGTIHYALRSEIQCYFWPVYYIILH